MTYSCMICHGVDFELLYASTLPAARTDMEIRFRCTSDSYGVHDDILRCSGCGLVFTVPSYSSEELIEHYTRVEDLRYTAETEGRRQTFRRNARPIKALVGSNRCRLLDVGCHIGVFLEVAAEQGWEAWGVEPSQWAAGYAQQRGLQVLATTVAEANFDNHFFDIVTMWDVMEHLADPVGEMRAIHRILRPGGLLVVHTMDIGSLFARLMGSRWPWLMEMHRFFYTPHTLSLHLEQMGFRQFEVRRQGRYLRFEYLVSRLAPYLPRATAWLTSLVHGAHLDSLLIPVNFGDLFTSFSTRLETVDEG